LHEQQFKVAKETRVIASRNYTLEKYRFLRGAITINDLNAAQQQKDNAENMYITAIQIYWELYYTLRRLTLYDFINHKKIDLNSVIESEGKEQSSKEANQLMRTSNY
jgi:hypothetical protein